MKKALTLSIVLSSLLFSGEIKLKKGWNLISPEETTSRDSLELSSVVSYKTILTPFGDMVGKEIEPEQLYKDRGYWVLVERDKSISVNSSTDISSPNLSAGWNLVGFHNFSNFNEVKFSNRDIYFENYHTYKWVDTQFDRLFIRVDKPFDIENSRGYLVYVHKLKESAITDDGYSINLYVDKDITLSDLKSQIENLSISEIKNLDLEDVSRLEIHKDNLFSSILKVSDIDKVDSFLNQTLPNTISSSLEVRDIGGEVVTIFKRGYSYRVLIPEEISQTVETILSLDNKFLTLSNKKEIGFTVPKTAGDSITLNLELHRFLEIGYLSQTFSREIDIIDGDLPAPPPLETLNGEVESGTITVESNSSLPIFPNSPED